MTKPGRPPGSRKTANGTYDPDQHDDYDAQRKVERLPLAVLTDEWLRTQWGTDESREKLSRVKMEMA